MTRKKAHNYYVYILECINGSYYTGITTDLARRFEEHKKGTAKCKYTRSFKPIRIAQSWEIKDDKSLAMRTEKHIKGLSKKEKEILIRYPTSLANFFDNAT